MRFWLEQQGHHVVLADLSPELLAIARERTRLLGRTIAAVDERHHLRDTGWLRALLERGEFVNDVPGRFDGGYGARPEDVEPFMESYGFETISLSSAEV